MEETFRTGNFLQLAERRLEQQHETFVSLDQKAWQNISISSIIIGLFVAFNLQATLEAPLGTLKAATLIALAVALGTYVVGFFIALSSRMPITFEYPIEMTWSVSVEALNDKDDEQYYAFLISSYVDAITRNDKRLNTKANQVWVSTALLGISIIALASAAIIQAM